MIDENMELHLQVGPAEQAVHQLFESMLGMEIAPTGVDQWSCIGPVVGIIHLSGGWDGFVLTGFEPTLARVVTARMLGGSEESPEEEDLRDAVGEVANILAGNLKCLIPTWTEMSIPAVIEGTVTRRMEIGSAAVNRLYFNTDYGRFWLTMVPSGGAGLLGADASVAGGQADLRSN